MFSGAVRAVFRKKKGFGFVKILHWLLLVLFSAAAALADQDKGMYKLVVTKEALTRTDFPSRWT